VFNPSDFANIARTEESFWWFRGMRGISFALLDRWIGRLPGRRALEAGCGTGHFAAALAARCPLDLTALDLEWEGIRYCRERRELRPVQASIASLPFPDGAFDLVTCMDVLVHYPEGQEGPPFAELARVVRPGGLLFVRVSALPILRSRHSEFTWERQRFTRPRLRALAQGAGLEILRLTYTNFLLTPVALVKFRIWEPLTRQPPASGLAPVPVWLDRLLYSALAMERHWLAQGGGFPWGQSLYLLAQKRPSPKKTRVETSLDPAR
jgi:SAM-dependent methyltransferase